MTTTTIDADTLDRLYHRMGLAVDILWAAQSAVSTAIRKDQTHNIKHEDIASNLRAALAFLHDVQEGLPERQRPF